MIKKIILLLGLLLPTWAFAQADRKLDTDGNLLYQYQRTVSEPCDTCKELTVTLLFVNGNRPAAISLRQEVRLFQIPQWHKTACKMIV